MGGYLSKVGSEPQEIELLAQHPQPRAGVYLRLIDPSAERMSAAQAPNISGRCERAGKEVGFLAWRLVSRSLQWLDSRQETVSATTTELRDPVTSAPVNGRRLDSPRGAVSLARQPASVVAGPQRQSSPVGRSIGNTGTWDRPRSRRSTSSEPVDFLRDFPHVSREPLPAHRLLRTADFGGPAPVGRWDLTAEKARGLVAVSIPPLLTFALRRWARPSWADLAEVACEVAVQASGKIQATLPRNHQPRSFLTVLASVAFATASGVATISSSALLQLAATSPWALALLGGVLLLAIIWRAMEGQGTFGLVLSPAGGPFVRR
jgi:hypothetical protein